MTQPIEPPDPDIHPSDVLLNLIVTCLAPMFLIASNGNFLFARMAALETINAYRARDPMDLIAIAQIVGCSLAALGSLSLSMGDDLSLSMTLRLRGNAVALNRTVEHARRALKEPRPDLETIPPIDTEYEAAVRASVAETQKRVEETKARPQTTEQPATGLPPLTEQQKQELWASAMSDVAGESSASLAHLPPAERKIASRHAAILSSCANQLLSGDVQPRPGPDDLPIPR